MIYCTSNYNFPTYNESFSCFGHLVGQKCMYKNGKCIVYQYWKKFLKPGWGKVSRHDNDIDLLYVQKSMSQDISRFLYFTKSIKELFIYKLFQWPQNPDDLFSEK